MSRPLPRRLAVVAAASACLASAAVPAVAQDASTGLPVMITTTGGSRLFEVTQTDGTALTGFDFGPGGQLPWRVAVIDSGVPLLGNDYAVNAKMSNLYYQSPADGSTDWTTKIPSSSLSLGYGPNALGATGLSLPVTPEVLLQGALTCEDYDLLSLPLGALLDLCTAVTDLLTAGTGTVSTTALAGTQTLDTADLAAAAGGALDLAGLPLALLGAQEGGRFTNPASAGPGDPETGTSATSKRVMTGTARLVGDTLAGTLSLVTGALTHHLGGLPMTPMQGTTTTGSLLTLSEVRSAMSAQSTQMAEIASLLGQVAEADALKVLKKVTGTLQAVTADRLSTMSGTYSALPVLAAEAMTVKAGTYKGTLTVDFFQQ